MTNSAFWTRAQTDMHINNHSGSSRKEHTLIVHRNQEDREVWKVQVKSRGFSRVSSRLALRVAVGFPFWVVPAECAHRLPVILEILSRAIDHHQADHAVLQVQSSEARRIRPSCPSPLPPSSPNNGDVSYELYSANAPISLIPSQRATCMSR